MSPISVGNVKEEKCTLIICVYEDSVILEECNRMCGSHGWKESSFASQKVYPGYKPSRPRRCLLTLDFYKPAVKLQCCGESSTPTWTEELMTCVVLERLTYTVEKKDKRFAHLWNSYMFFGNSCFLIDKLK